MSANEYYNHLRTDSSVCFVSEIKVQESFYNILDTVLMNKKQYEKCLSDPNPYIFTIDIKEKRDSILYKIENLYSTLHSEKYYSGGFIYQNEIFLVSNLTNSDSVFYFDLNPSQIEIPFCDRIYHPDYTFIAIIKKDNISTDCIKFEKIKIK